MNLAVTVLHNVSRDMFLRYNPETSKLYHAHTFQVYADSVEEAANLVWLLANVDDADDLSLRAPHLGIYRNQVTEYRARMNRSLSVSDVLLVHRLERDATEVPVGALAVAMIGHEDVDFPEHAAGSNATPTSVSYEAHRRWHEEVNRG